MSRSEAFEVLVEIAKFFGVSLGSHAGSESASSTAKDEERQTALSNEKETIWGNIHAGNVEGLKRLATRSPAVLEERGAVGELPIHLCFLFGGEPQLEMAWWMIEQKPELISAVYVGDEYAGENVLHISIVKKRVDLVKLLIEKEPVLLLQGMCTGNFFKYGKPCYYGESPLAFALTTNQYEIFDILIEAGADMNTVDSNGNNCLHVCVARGLQKSYAFFKDKWIKRHGEGLLASSSSADGEGEEEGEGSGIEKKKKGALKAPWQQRNKGDFTPFGLCAQIGNAELFDYLLQESKITQWSYGPVSAVLYPLEGIDDLKQKEAGEVSDGALEIIINGAQIELLKNPIILKLIEKKWDAFAKRAMLARFIIMSFYLSVFGYFCIQSKSMWLATKEKLPLCGSSSTDVVGETCSSEEDLVALTTLELAWLYIKFYCSLAFVVAGAAFKAYREGEEIKSSGIISYFSSTGSAFFENFMSLAFSTLVLLYTAAHLGGLHVQRILLAFAAIFGYGYMFFFLLAMRLTGPMVMMIASMITNDVVRFFLVYLVFLLAFGQAFFILDDAKNENFLDHLKQCFLATLGDFDLSSKDDHHFSSASVILLISFIIVVSVLLLNLLIAMMGDTYGRISDDAENNWQLERARIIFAVENEMTAEERKEPRNSYFFTMEGKRYMQINEIQDDHFANKEEDKEADAAN